MKFTTFTEHHRQLCEDNFTGQLQPEIQLGDFWRVEYDYGILFFPVNMFSKVSLEEEYETDDAIITKVSGYFGRMSINGYLDCTEWEGPHNTLYEALINLINLYGENE